MPKISIIMPAYNALPHIPRAVDSVLAQSLGDWELIIVDDGSADGTAGICEKYAGLDSRITVISQKNSGVSAARNAGIRAAAGEYLAFLDSDDYLEPGAYGTMLGVMTDNASSGCVCGYYSVGCGVSRVPVPGPLGDGIFYPEDIRQGLILPLLCGRLSKTPLLGTVWRYLFSAEVIKNSGLEFSGVYLEDELFLIEYLSAANALSYKLSGVSLPLYNYYQNPISATHRYMKDCERTFLSSLDKKAGLISKYRIPAPADWILSSAWAGLLICVSNEFAPGSIKSFSQKLSALRSLCETPEFFEAMRDYKPSGMSINKMVVAGLLRRKLFFPLALLYAVKNRSKERSV